MEKKTMDDVCQEVEEKKLIAVRFEQTFPSGVVKSKTVHASRFRHFASNGINFFLGHHALDCAGGVALGTGYADEIGFRDGISLPVFETFQVLPWVERMGRVLIEPTDQGEFVAGNPRVVARRQLDRLKDLGISMLSAHEHEFYVVYKDTLKPINNDINAHATVRNASINGFLHQIMEYLPQVGVSIEHAMTEYGPGQLEITYEPAFGIRAADNAHTYKTSIKEIAVLNGYVASFMTKPYPDHSGSSAHLCHSLWDANGNVPLLYDPNTDLGISELGQHWIAGILAHAAAIQVLMGPTVNCFKRLKPFSFAPMHALWGIENRSCLLRVKVNRERGTYFEQRGGAAASNPYISLAATVAAGIDGIVNKLELPPEFTGNAYAEDEVPQGTRLLPTNMEDALTDLKNDKTICDALGEEFIKCFMALKVHETKLAKEALVKKDGEWEFKHFFMYL